MPKLAQTIALGLAAACAPKVETPEIAAAAPKAAIEQTSLSVPDPTNENNSQSRSEPDAFADRIERALASTRKIYLGKSPECEGAYVDSNIRISPFPNNEAADIARISNASERCIAGYVAAMNRYFSDRAAVQGATDIMCDFDYQDRGVENTWLVTGACMNLNK